MGQTTLSGKPQNVTNTYSFGSEGINAALKIICHYPAERLANQCAELEAALQCHHVFQIS